MTAITDSVWRLDPDRSSIEFHVPSFYGLINVKGRFGGYEGRLEGDALKVSGRLHAAGQHTALDVDATLREVDDELEIEARALADHRELGMTFSPLGLIGAPSRLIVRGRLLRGPRPYVEPAATWSRDASISAPSALSAPR